jgi:hypothetical protein
VSWELSIYEFGGNRAAVYLANKNHMMTGTDAMRQAHMTAHDYMMNAIHDIDELLEKGYARAHPELIAAYMRTAAQDFDTACRLGVVEGDQRTHSGEFLLEAIREDT